VKPSSFTVRILGRVLLLPSLQAKQGVAQLQTRLNTFWKRKGKQGPPSPLCGCSCLTNTEKRVITKALDCLNNSI